MIPSRPISIRYSLSSTPADKSRLINWETEEIEEEELSPQEAREIVKQIQGVE